MSILEQLRDRVTQYIDINLKLVKISFIERTSMLLSYFIYTLVVLFIFFCIILFAGFGLTELFASAGFSKAAAFFLTLGVYVLLLILAIVLRTRITRFFAGEIVNVMTEVDTENDNEEEE